MLVPKLEQQMGIEAYATKCHGIGGVIRQNVEDFAVEEILVDGSKATVTPPAEHQVLGSSPVADRFLLCVLAKRNWDTFQAVRSVAEQLGISAERIKFAGIKDAKAVTAQHITIEGVSLEETRKVHVKDLEIRPVGYFHSALSAFYLHGNSFTITINAIDHAKPATEKRISKTIKELASIGGVPNFFGHQRFGTTRCITHLIGKAIIQGDFRRAAMLLLAKPSPHEHSQSREAREELHKTQDFKKALEGFPKQLRYERLMLKRLVEEPDDYVGAFRTLPSRLLELFVQAYQSYLFNRFLSGRIKHGLRLDRAEVGDYVVKVDRSGLPMPRMHVTATDETLAEANNAVNAGKMLLALPLIGFKQQPSSGLQGEIERQVLKEESVSPEDFRIESLPEISSRGGLRTVLTPLDSFRVDEISEDLADRSKCRARVSFVLRRGSYATVVLRELMKPNDLIRAGF